MSCSLSFAEVRVQSFRSREDQPYWKDGSWIQFPNLYTCAEVETYVPTYPGPRVIEIS